MEKLKVKSQNLKLLLLASLLIITPLLPTSFRLKYLYFIINILIIALGAEAGLLSFMQPHQNTKSAAASSSSSLPVQPNDASIDKAVKDAASCVSSEQSNFFIGGGESGRAEGDQLGEDAMEDHELFYKAEKFIGNFYKQLKMQRQESWNGFDRVSQH